MGAGVFILANSRPFEGAARCLPVMIALVVWRPKNPSGSWRWKRQVVAPLALMLAAEALSTGYYFWRATSSPFVMPHQLNQKLYSMSSPFVWQPAPVLPVYRHAFMAKLYRERWVTYDRMRSRPGFARRFAGKIATFAAFFTGPVLVTRDAAAVSTQLSAVGEQL